MKKSTITSIFGALLIAMPVVTINAQTAAQLAPNRVATNLAGATTSIAPPAGFNPVEATDADLATFGFPPRPDANLAPGALASWTKAMNASKVRVSPRLVQNSISHGPKKSPGTKAEVTSGTGTSYNWNAMVDFSGASSYNSTTSFYFLTAEFVVPIAKQAFGTCTGTTDYAASWVGIDGAGSGDVLQAGTQSMANCGSASYYAWYEWYPYNEVGISNFPVAPGDDMFVEVWNTSATQGYVYMVNYNNNQAVEIGFNAPSGTRLVGNSAEWVVERPGVNGSLATLANYISDYFSDCYAYTHNYTEYVPGSYNAYNYTMLDNSGYQISYATLLGSTGIWFQDENSARFSSEP
jgi:hypothetical protein